MNILSKSSLAAGLILAVFGTTNVAHAGFEKFFLSGNLGNCQEVFIALEAQHPVDFLPGTFGAVAGEILVSPLTDATANGPFTATNGQIVTIPVVAEGESSFDWEETTSTKLGFDVVSIKAGNGRTIYYYTPDATEGQRLSDLNTTKRISEVLFCSDSNVTIVEGGALCAISSNLLGDICNAVGNTKVIEIFDPGALTTQICACPDVTFSVCSPAAIGSDGDATAEPPIEPSDPNICDPDTESCCLISPFCAASEGDDPNTREDCPLLTLEGAPVGTTTVPLGLSPQFCSVSTTTSAGGGATSFQFCFGF